MNIMKLLVIIAAGWFLIPFGLMFLLLTSGWSLPATSWGKSNWLVKITILLGLIIFLPALLFFALLGGVTIIEALQDIQKDLMNEEKEFDKFDFFGKFDK